MSDSSLTRPIKPVAPPIPDFRLGYPEVSPSLAFGADEPSPVKLSEKYRPKTLCDVFGQGSAICQLQAFLDAPYPVAFLFDGPTGVGKTSTALALAAELGVDPNWSLIHIRSGEQDGDAVLSALKTLRFSAVNGGWKMILLDEADYMSEKCRNLWLSALEDLPSRSVIVFTTNHPEKFQDRFLDRCERITFGADADTLSLDALGLVKHIWKAETGRDDHPSLESLPNVVDRHGNVSFRRIVSAMEPLLRSARLNPPVTPIVEPEPVKASKPAAAMLTAMLTATLVDGTVVAAKKDKWGISASTYANRTQAEKRRDAIISEGGKAEVIQRGRPFFVRLNGSPVADATPEPSDPATPPDDVTAGPPEALPDVPHGWTEIEADDDDAFIVRTLCDHVDVSLTDLTHDAHRARREAMLSPAALSPVALSPVAVSPAAGPISPVASPISPANDSPGVVRRAIEAHRRSGRKGVLSAPPLPEPPLSPVNPRVVFDVIKTVGPGAPTGDRPGAWLVETFSTIGYAHELCRICNESRPGDGIDYHVCSRDEGDPGRPARLEDMRRLASGGPPESPLPGPPDPLEGITADEVIGTIEDPTDSAIVGRGRLARVEDDGFDPDGRIHRAQMRAAERGVRAEVMPILELHGDGFRARSTDAVLSRIAGIRWNRMDRYDREDFAAWCRDLDYKPGEYHYGKLAPDEAWAQFLIECIDGTPIFPLPGKPPQGPKEGPEGEDTPSTDPIADDVTASPTGAAAHAESPSALDHDRGRAGLEDAGHHLSHAREVIDDRPGRGTPGHDRPGGGGSTLAHAEGVRRDRQAADPLGTLVILAHGIGQPVIRHSTADAPPAPSRAFPTLEIGGRAYGLAIDGGTITLEKGDGAAYEITRGDAPTCSCPDFRYRHAGLPTAGCRHVQALRSAGLLPPFPGHPPIPRSPSSSAFPRLPISSVSEVPFWAATNPISPVFSGDEGDATRAMAAMGIRPVSGGAPEARTIEAPAPAREEDVEAESMQPEPPIPVPTFLVVVAILGALFWLLGRASQLFPMMP